ncbi:MAG: hypothetical protein Q9163_004919 [Psora crenata]
MPAPPAQSPRRGHVPQEHLFVPPHRREPRVVRAHGEVEHLVAVGFVGLDEAGGSVAAAAFAAGVAAGRGEDRRQGRGGGRGGGRLGRIIQVDGPQQLTNRNSPFRNNREDAESKKAEAARKKAEKDALLAAEEASLPSRAAPKNSKTATKKSKGLDLSELDDDGGNDSIRSNNKAMPALNATGIDNALDALSLTSNNASDKIDRHPERRFKAAYAAFEARRLPEIEEEHKGLRKNQRVEICRKEFDKSPENPFNQVNARFDSTREDVRELKDREREKTEARLVRD